MKIEENLSSFSIFFFLQKEEEEDYKFIEENGLHQSSDS
jgi:hypothetical protein